MSVILIFLYMRFISLFALPSPIEYSLLLRGLLSDFFVSVILYYFLVRPLKFKWQLIVQLLLTVILALNLVHIRINGAHVDINFWRHIFEPSFTFGSVFTGESILWIFAMCMSTTAIIFITVKLNKYVDTKEIGLPPKTLPLAMLLALFGLILLPAHAHLDWQGSNLVEHNVRSSLGALFQFNKKSNNSSYHSIHPQNLAGNKFIESQPRANVLLIMIESLSNKHIQEGFLPKLNRLASENLSYSQFVAPQRQTNRGLYSALCGRYPNFQSSIAKSDLLLTQAPQHPCLPQILKDNGYNTVFMQSANLGYMNKERFGHSIGFDETIGENDYGNITLRTRWGVDDGTLYSNAVQKLGALNSEAKPWFATLLTSGTHHPYAVPDGNGTFKQALAYADTTVSNFIDKLRRTGILDNTIVLIISDEANASGAGFVSNPLWDNWAPLIVLLPKNNKRQIESTPYTFADISLSILDIVEIRIPQQLGGRSFFRRYSEERPILFANIYTKSTFALTNNTLTVCNQFFKCWHASSENSLFSEGTFNVMPASPQRVNLMKKIVQVNDQFLPDARNQQLVEFGQTSFNGKSDYLLLGKYRTYLKTSKTIRYQLDVDNSISNVASPVTITIYTHPCDDFTPKVATKQSKIIAAGESLSWKAHTIDSGVDKDLCHYISAQTTEDNTWQLRKLSLSLD